MTLLSVSLGDRTGSCEQGAAGETRAREPRLSWGPSDSVISGEDSVGTGPYEGVLRKGSGTPRRRSALVLFRGEINSAFKGTKKAVGEYLSSKGGKDC